MMTTTAAPAPAPQSAAATRALRLALIAPPTATTPPSSLGGLDQVRWLAGGLAERGHQVTLIGADLGELIPGGYTVIETNPTCRLRASAEIVERLHAELAGKAVERLGQVDLVSDHTRTGWLPAGQVGLNAWTVPTSYGPLIGPWAPAPKVASHSGWVAVSGHQRRNAAGLPWTAVIHPAIPIGGRLLNLKHAGPCVYLGPLLEAHGAAKALEAAHHAGEPIVLVGTRPGAEATT